jgi:hypothetical protein
MILIYPVISFTESCKHSVSKESLLGKNPVKDLIINYSNEFLVKNDNPPLFFIHIDNDCGIPAIAYVKSFSKTHKSHIYI